MKMLIVNCLIAICALGVCAGDNDGFISRWLICGPFPSYEVKGQDGGTGLDTDFLNGEANARPVPGKKYETVFLADESKMIVALDVTNEWGVRNSRTITSEWKEMSFSNPRKILMDEVFPPIKDHFVFFAACYIESPRAQEIRIRLGSDDDHKLYLNGEMIGRAPTCQDATPRFVYKAKLKRGLNLLLLKVVDRIFDCGFCLTLEKPDGSVLDNVKLYADSPARKLGAEAYDNGFAVNFNVPAKTLYDDDKKMQLNIRFFAPDQNPYTLKLGEKQTTLTNDGTWELEVPLRAGNVELCCRVFDADGKDVAELSRQLQVYSRTTLKQQRAKLEREAEVLKRQQEALRSELAANRDRLNKAKRELELARKSAEDNYAKIRKEAEKDAAASIDERFKPAPGLRSSLLLNGVWRAGEKQEKLDSSLRLPLEMYGPYYRLWNYPDDIYSNQKNRFSVKMCPLPGYKDCVFNELICSKKVTFEQDFTFDGTGGDVYFVCDNIIGNAEVFCNGASCGKYSGTVGLVEMKLKNLKKDKNTLRIDYSVTPLITDQEASCYGIVGDLRLEYRNPVHVADVWIRPSWRKASLLLTSEIFNPEKTPVSYKLLQYAVRNDHVKFRFPEKSGRLAPDEVTIVDQETKWRDPELYSLENPCLYDLVSDLYIDDRLVDRKVDSFGFREFWIHPTSFLSAPAHKMPLDRQNLENGNPIVVTEYLEISSKNGNNNKIAVVSWLGGMAGIARTDLTPLLVTSFYYLLKLADNETDGKRAVKVMLKFLSTLKEQGFFHFKILDTIYCDIIDEGRIGLLCQRYKVEIPDNLAGENCGIGLNWRPPSTVGSTIFGRSVQEGRLHLMHSPNGTGKTLFTQVMANILIRGDAPDFGEPLSFQPGRIFRFFYIQSEMQAGDVPHDDMQERQKRIDRLFGKALHKGMLTFYKPAGDICKLSEQESIVGRLAELDPDGKSQWIIVVDNILSVMPSATTKSGYDKIKPWFEALKALGVTIFLIHHDNLENGSYGTSAILNDADSRWHITLTDQVRDEIVQALPSEIRNDLNTYGQLQDATEALARMNTAARKVYVKVGKGRHLSASDMRPFSIQWTLSDTVQKLSSEYSDYSDLEAIVQKKLLEYKAKLELSGGKNTTTPDCDMNSTAAPSEVIAEANGSNTGQTQVYAGTLPTSFAGLKGLDGENQRKALLELRLKHGSIKAVGSALDCSESSIEGLCQDHGITKKAVEVYAAMKDAEVK